MPCSGPRTSWRIADFPRVRPNANAGQRLKGSAPRQHVTKDPQVHAGVVLAPEDENERLRLVRPTRAKSSRRTTAHPMKPQPEPSTPNEASLSPRLNCLSFNTLCHVAIVTCSYRFKADLLTPRQHNGWLNSSWPPTLKAQGRLICALQRT